MWNEQDGEQMKFDKVIFNDLPAEWIERFVQPGTGFIPSPDMMTRDQEVMFRMRQDSLRKWQNLYRDKAELYKKMQNLQEKKFLQQGSSLTPLSVRLKKAMGNDSLFKKMEPFFPEGLQPCVTTPMI